MEPYPSWQFGYIDDLDPQFGNRLVWTRTQTQSDSPELLLTLNVSIGNHVHSKASKHLDFASTTINILCTMHYIYVTDTCTFVLELTADQFIH